MKTKFTALIILACLLICAMQNVCFAGVFSFSPQDNNAEISSAESRLINLLSGAENIAETFRVFSGGAFYAAFAGCKNDAQRHFSTIVQAVITSVLVSLGCMHKKTVFFKYFTHNVYKPFKDFMRRTPFSDSQTAPVYLLCIDALHKGSVPASFISFSKF